MSLQRGSFNHFLVTLAAVIGFVGAAICLVGCLFSVVAFIGIALFAGHAPSLEELEEPLVLACGSFVIGLACLWGLYESDKLWAR